MAEIEVVSGGRSSERVCGGDKPELWRFAAVLIAAFAIAALALPSFASAAARLDLNASHTPAGNLKNGQTATFTASITNTGNAPSQPTAADNAISSLGIFLPIPAGTTLVGFDSDTEDYWNGGLGDGCQFLDLLGTQQIVCVAPTSTTLDPNESTPPVHVTLRVNGNASGTITPQWSGQLSPISGPPWHPTKTDPFTVEPSPAFKLETTPQAGLIKRGSTAQLDLDLTNEGPLATDATTMTITDTLPAGLTLQSASSPGGYWSCSGNQTVSCISNGAIPPGDHAPTLTLTVDVAASAADTVTNQATADGGGVVAAAESSTDLPVFGAGAQPVRLMVDPHSGATSDGLDGSFVRIHKAGKPILMDFSNASHPIVLKGAVDGDDVRIPKGSIDLPEFTLPNFDLGIPLALTLDMKIGMNATGDWGGTIDSSGNADLNMPMSFDYALVPSLLPIDAIKCESGPVDLSNLTTGHQDASNSLPPDPVTDGSPFTNGNGTVIDNGFTIGAASSCAVNPLVGLLVPGVTSSLVTPLVNRSMGTPGTGSQPGNADAQIQLHQVDPAGTVLSLEKTVPAGSELFIDDTQTGAGTFRIAVNNSGGVATDGSDLTVTDDLPAGTSYDSFNSSDPNWSCSASGQTVTCVLTATALASGDTSNPVDILVTTNRDAWPSVVNEAAISGGGATGVSHAVKHTDLVVHGPRLGLEVTGPDDGYTVGQPSATIRVAVSNQSANATGGQPTSGQIYTTGHLPPGVAYDDSINVAPWSCNGSEPDENGQDVNCSYFSSGGAAIPPGGTRNLALPVKIAQETGDSIETTWSATGGGAPQITDPNDVTATIAILRPGLNLAMSVDGDLRNGGSGGSFIISLDNAGDGSTTSNPVTISDTLPAGLTPVNTSSEGGYWDCSTNGQRVSCDNAGESIEPGESAPDLNIEVAVEDPPVPVLTNVARATGGASPPASASVTVNTSGPVLSVTSAHSGDFATGKQGQYRLLVSNDGDSDTDGTRVTVTDTLPEGLGYVGAGSAGNFWDCSAAGQEVTCTSDETIEAGSKAPVLRLTTSVRNAAVPGVTNVVRVSGGGSLPASDADPTNVVKSAPVRGARLGKVVVKPKVRKIRPGGSAVFGVRVSNNGDRAGKKAKVCLRAAKRYVAVRGKKCRSLGTIRPGQTKARNFRVRLKRKARNLRRRTLPVKFEARIPNANGTKVRRANARIKVIKPGKRNR